MSKAPIRAINSPVSGGDRAEQREAAQGSAAGLGSIRDRVKELRRVPASSLQPHPKNAREHPESQRKAMREVLNHLGFAGAILAVEREGSLLTCDGHLRGSEMGDREVPVLVLDLNDAEVETLLLTFDPLAAMALTNKAKAESLAATVRASAAGLQGTIDQVLANLGKQAEEALANQPDVEMVKFDVSKPPTMAWVLIGISTVRFGEINQQVERLATIPGIIVETALNNS